MTGLPCARERISGTDDITAALPSRPRREIDIWTFSQLRRTNAVGAVSTGVRPVPSRPGSAQDLGPPKVLVPSGTGAADIGGHDPFPPVRRVQQHRTVLI